MSGWWSSPEEGTRREIGTKVLHDRLIIAVEAARDALRPLGLALREAEQVAYARYDALGDGVRRGPPDPLDVSSRPLPPPMRDRPSPAISGCRSAFASPDVPDDEAPRRRRPGRS